MPAILVVLLLPQRSFYYPRGPLLTLLTFLLQYCSVCNTNTTALYVTALYVMLCQFMLYQQYCPLYYCGSGVGGGGGVAALRQFILEVHFWRLYHSSFQRQMNVSALFRILLYTGECFIGADGSADNNRWTFIGSSLFYPPSTTREDLTLVS